MRLEMKRLAPGEMNIWFVEVMGTEGGVRFSTKEPKTLWRFERTKEYGYRKANTWITRFIRVETETTHFHADAADRA